MKTASSAFTTTLKSDYSITPQMRVIANWNQNRYGEIADVFNAAGDFDSEEFPIESIAEPDRPRSQGIAKARVTDRGASRVAEGYTTSGYEDVPEKRTYTVSADSAYKYWSSPNASAKTAIVGSPGEYAIANVQPRILYGRDSWINSISITFESSLVTTVKTTLKYTIDGTNWLSIVGDFSTDANGKILLYRQGDGSWSTTVGDNPIKVRGIGFDVSRISQADSYLNVIELAGLLRKDLSHLLINYDATFSMAERSFIVPLGQSSSNTGNITLFNKDGMFDNENAASDYYQLMDKNVRVAVEMGVDTTRRGGPGTEWVRMLTMNTDAWDAQAEDTVSASLVDSSRILQERKPNSMLLKNCTVGEIIWRLCDSVGFSSYEYAPKDTATSERVTYYWTDPEKSVWEHFNDLSQALQIAIYFDEWDVLRIQTRDSAYDIDRATDWTIDDRRVTLEQATADGRSEDAYKLPDMIDLSRNYDFEANKVTVSYTKTYIDEKKGNVLPMKQVWQPEETVVLRSSALKSDLTAVSTSGVFDYKDMAHWPYEGVMQIEREFIRWNGKQYAYYDTNGTKQTKYVRSADEKAKCDKENTFLSSRNSFTGRLWFGSNNRGIWNSVATTHDVKTGNYTARWRKEGGTVLTNNWYLKRDFSNSKMQLQGTKAFNGKTWYVVGRGASGDPTPRYVGTRVLFPNTKSYDVGSAGVAMGLTTNDAGYFAEITRTSAVGQRQYANELRFYVRKVDGSITPLGPNGGKGVPLSVAPSNWYDLDVYYTPEAGQHRFMVMVNGIQHMSILVPSANDLGATVTGRHGFYIRGFTHADFEYFYSNRHTEPADLEETTWWDYIKGGYQSALLHRKFLWASTRWGRVMRKSWTAYRDKYEWLFMDDFGPIAHEVREFDVKFAEFPVVHSRMYFSNEESAFCMEYLPTPFGAKFILVNKSRGNAVLNGEDTLMFGSDNPVSQTMMVYGRTVNRAEAEKVTVENKLAQTKRGVVEVDIDNQWIQSKSAAQELADWINARWSGGCDEVEVQIFGNPLIEVGDAVRVNAPSERIYYASHKYHVVEVRQSYTDGPETSVVLRRLRGTS